MVRLLDTCVMYSSREWISLCRLQLAGSRGAFNAGLQSLSDAFNVMPSELAGSLWGHLTQVIVAVSPPVLFWKPPHCSCPKQNCINNHVPLTLLKKSGDPGDAEIQCHRLSR